MNSLLMTNGKDISSNLFHSIAIDPLILTTIKGLVSMARGRSLLIIDDRALDRQCLAYCISAHKWIWMFSPSVRWKNGSASGTTIHRWLPSF
jgi:hypothetical protein